MFSSRSRIDRTQERPDRREDHSKSSRKSTDRIQSKRFNYLGNLKIIERQFATSRHPQLAAQPMQHGHHDLLEEGKRHYKQNNLRKAVECFLMALSNDELNV